MPSNNSNAHKLAANYPSRLGLLMSPDGLRTPRKLPWAMDNGLYGAWKASGFVSEYDAIMNHWKLAKFLDALGWAVNQDNQPRWVVVPDCPGNAEMTRRLFCVWGPAIQRMGFQIAIAVQDGMTPDDVPGDSVCFIGGTTEWKWKTVELFARHCPRVHVGRVNRYRRLWQCHDAGVESVDGTGFFRGDQPALRGLLNYLSESAGEKKREKQMSLAI